MSETPPSGMSDQPRRDPQLDDTGLFRPAPPRDRPQPDREPDPEQTTAYFVPIPDETKPDSPPGPTRPQQVSGALRSLVRNWPVLVSLAALAVAAVIIPTLTNIATTDDWGYSRSVEILIDEGELTVFPVVAATAVGQILWGALFASIFGMSLGMMRVSTVVMVALGGIALYAILRMLGVSRARSAIGMGLWLFNPLTFSLAFSFMTDAHFASVMLISLAFYVKGLRPDRESLRMIVIGSFFAGFAFLIRQQGALIPLSVAVYLVMTRRIWLRRESLNRLLAVALLPAVMFVGYYLWLRWFNDVPEVQEAFLDEVREKGWEGTWLLIRRLPIYVLFYAGLFLLPIFVAIFPRESRNRGVSLFASPLTFYAFLLWTATVIGGLYFAGRRDHEMPFVPQFVGLGGLGPPDVLGSRQRLVERGTELPILLTVIAALGAILLGLVICRKLISGAGPERAGFWLVMMVGFWQFVGIFPPSYHYTNRGVTLDRYLLPVIAIAIIAALWALRDINLFQPIAWLALAAVAVFSVMGVRDYIVYMEAVWDMAEYANENGVENDRLDAGSAWDGYHLYTVMLDENITKARSPQGSPWWVYFYAKPTDSSYVVTTDIRAVSGYTRVETREYDQWLEDDPVYVHLMKRWYLPFPVGEGQSDWRESLPGPWEGTSTPDPTPTPTPIPSPPPNVPQSGAPR